MAVDLVLLYLSHVMRDVINLVQVKIPHLAGERFLKSETYLMCQHLAIGKSEVGRASHGMEVLLAFGRVKRSADQLAIGQLNAVIMYRLLKAADVILTDLMTETA